MTHTRVGLLAQCREKKQWPTRGVIGHRGIPAGTSRKASLETDYDARKAASQVVDAILRLIHAFPGEAAALVLIWATLEQDRLVWRGVQMDRDLRLRIVEAAQATSSGTIDVSVLDRYLDAA